jgi:hypothetical protein
MKLIHKILDLFDKYVFAIIELGMLIFSILIMLVGGFNVLDTIMRGDDFTDIVYNSKIVIVGIVLFLLVRVVRIYAESKKSQ